jgi:hypothetical protein
MGFKAQLCPDDGIGGIEGDIEFDGLYQPVRGAIIGKTNGNGLFSAHVVNVTMGVFRCVIT